MTDLIKKQTNKRYWIILVVAIVLIGIYGLTQIDYSKFKNNNEEKSLNVTSNETDSIYKITRLLELEAVPFGNLISLLMVFSLCVIVFAAFGRIAFGGSNEV